MVKTKFTNEDIKMFFLRSNLSYHKLGDLLDIPEYKLRSYLTGRYGAHLSCEEALKIDTAIKVITELDLESPKWTIGNYRKEEYWNDTVGKWNNEVMELINKRIEEMYNNACNIIVFIIEDKFERDDFHTVEDPLKYGGLERYGKDEFIGHFKKTMVMQD